MVLIVKEKRLLVVLILRHDDECVNTVWNRGVPTISPKVWATAPHQDEEGRASMYKHRYKCRDALTMVAHEEIV